jgi:hypothetical protein
MKVSKVIAFLFFAGFYALGNLGGNYVGWEVIFKWFDQANGAAKVDSAFTHPLVLFALAVAPSVGQWWRDWFGVKGRWEWTVYAIMAADLAINSAGFYFLAMGTFTFPPVWAIFAFLWGLAVIPNIVCQGIATKILKEIMEDVSNTRPRNKAARAPETPVNRRANGSIPAQVQVEELTL